MSANALDLSKLPPPAAVETLSLEVIIADIKTTLVSYRPDLVDVLELESEPLVKFVEALAYRETVLRNRLNHLARAVTLAFSTGADLDVAAANLGAQRIEGESDDDFRERAVLEPEAWSVAGPTGAYYKHAKGASPQVADVRVSTPVAGTVRLVILSTAADGVAAPALLATVVAALSTEDVRPLTDNIEVVSAAIASYDVVATLYLPGGPDAGAVEDAAVAAVQAYAASRRKLDKRVTITALTAALMRPGVEDLHLTSPAADIEADPETAPVLGDVTLTIVVTP